MENWGGEFPFPYIYRKWGYRMYTISSILDDLDGGILAHNMIETCFSYRIVYFVNENGNGRKIYVDTSYENLRRSLENIIRGNLTTTNTVVISAVTTLKDGKGVSLLSRAYGFNLSEYFRKICAEKEKDNINSNYGRRKVQWG